MSPEREVLLLIKGVISELPVKDHVRFEAALSEVRAVISKHGDVGNLALALLGAEAAASQK
jgi:hypothetical protein